MCWLLQDQVLWESCRNVYLQGAEVEKLLLSGHCVHPNWKAVTVLYYAKESGLNNYY